MEDKKRARPKSERPLDIHNRSDGDLLEKNWAINARKARSQFAQIIKASQVDRDRVVITEHGTPAVAVVPLSDLRILNILDQIGLKDKVSDASFRSVSIEELRQIINEEATNTDGEGRKRERRKQPNSNGAQKSHSHSR